MVADDQAVGQMYMEQYFLHKDPKMMDALRARLDEEMATPESQYASALPAHWDNARYPNMPLWWWCDALFMAPPVYADMAAATGDKKYLEFMDRSWDATAALLYNHEKHLYFRDATFLDKHEKNGEPLFWARGNGWVMGGIVRVLQEAARGFSAAAEVCGSAERDGGGDACHPGQRRIVAAGIARCRCVSAAGDFGQRLCDLRARVRSE